MKSCRVLLLSFLLAGSTISVGASEIVARKSVERACEFLVDLLSQPLGLVRETGSRQLFYVASDNLLAWRSLEVCGFSEESGRVLGSVWTMHEAVFGGAGRDGRAGKA